MAYHAKDMTEAFREFFKEDNPKLGQRTERMMRLAVKIDEGIKKNGMSKKDFAKHCGVAPSVVTKWLSGTQNFTIETLFNIEYILKIKLVNT